MNDEEIKKIKTGTTTVGIVCKDAVVLAAERKATMGYMVASKDTPKILQIDDHLGITIAGIVGDAQAIVRYIKAELKLYALQEEMKMSVESASTLVANILYSRRYYPFIVQLIIAGYDKKPHLFTLSPDGSVIEEEYFSTGSGSPMAFGLLENDFKKGMDVESAKKLAIKCVKVAIQRDIASGGSGIDLAVIDSKGFRMLPDEEVKSLVK